MGAGRGTGSSHPRVSVFCQVVGAAAAAVVVVGLGHGACAAKAQCGWACASLGYRYVVPPFCPQLYLIQPAASPGRR